MGRRKNKGQSSQAPASAADNGADSTVTVETGDVTVTVETNNDDDAVLAALEGADEGLGGSTDGSENDGETVETVATETVEVELEPEDEDAVLAELEAEEDDKAPAATGSKRSRKPAATKTPAVTRQFCDVADHLDASELKTRLDGIPAKKVAEKALNLVQCIETGKKLSGFTALAVKTLTEKGAVTSKDLVEAYQADGKTLGTARAQAQQMTALFKSMGIAQPDPADAKRLVACDNGLVRELATLAA